MTCGLVDCSDVTALAIDETSRTKGYSYLSLAADADARRILFVTQGRDAKAMEEFAQYLEDHGCWAEDIAQAGIDMQPALITGVTQHSPNVRITNDQVPRHRPHQHCS